MGKGERCRDHECVKLFDILITEFENVVELGEFFEFTYLIKGMADISDDVEIWFGISKDGKDISFGADTLYIGEYEAKTGTGKLVIPKSIEPGTYNFSIQLNHGAYSVKAYRTIEISIDEAKGIAEIRDVAPQEAHRWGIEMAYKDYLFLVLLAIILIILYIYYRKSERRGPAPAQAKRRL